MNVEELKKLLLSVGFPASNIDLFVAQILHETGGKIDSKLEMEGNNLTGIKYIGKSYQRNAQAGVLSPEGNRYAKFATLKDWAKDYKRILSLGAEKPLHATNVVDFVARLKNNAYFTDNGKNYLSGVSRHYSSLNNQA